MNKVLLYKFTILFFSITAFLFTHQLKAQSPNFEWAKNMGGTQNDQGNSIAIDSSGNVYTTGYFSGTSDFDPGAGTFNLTSNGSKDIFISKFDATGNFIWALQIGGIADDIGQSITIDKIGYIYITGIFIDTVDFNPGAGTYNLFSAGGGDIFILKLDLLGNYLWAKQFGGTSYDESFSIALDELGNIYTTGFFSDSVDFNPGPGIFYLVAGGVYDCFISKLDANGNFLWAKDFFGNYIRSIGIGLTIDNFGNVLTTGWLTSNFNGTEDVFVLKVDSLGNYIWSRQLAGLGHFDNGRSIVTDTLGNVYTTGTFRETAYFDNEIGGIGVGQSISSNGYYDIFILKLDALGEFVWAKNIGGTGADYGYSISLDKLGNVYTTGSFESTADFDPSGGVFNLTASGWHDMFISKLDSLGNFVWAKNIGGNGSADGHSIVVDRFNNLFITGVFNGNIDFNPNAVFDTITSYGNFSPDIFILKMSQWGVGITENSNSNNTVIYPNPAAGLFTIDLNTEAEINITNTLGQIVLNKKLNVGKQHINLESEANGIYFVRVTSNNIVSKHKIIKQ